MKILFGLIVCIVILYGNAEKSKEPNNLRSMCGTNCSSLVRLEQQVEVIRRATETILLQLTLHDQKVEQMLQDLHDLITGQSAKPGPPYQQIGSKYYYIEESQEISWFGAVNKCLAMDGHLVSFKSQDEFNAIKDKLRAGKDYWIDINDLAKDREYVSVATGRTPTYFNWKSGQPDHHGGNEHCVKLMSSSSYFMGDFICNRKHLFICEFRN